MADEQYISVQKGNQVKRIPTAKWKELWPVAQKKGWTRMDKATTPDATSKAAQIKPADQYGAEHLGRGGYSGVMPPAAEPDPMKSMTPFQALTKGVGIATRDEQKSSGDIFHQTPAGMPSYSGAGAGVKNFMGDMFNTRESAALFNAGNPKAGAAMMGGTALSMLGPEWLKMADKSMFGEKVLPHTEGLEKQAAKRAKGLVKEIGGKIDDARFSESLVSPIRNTLNNMFEEKLHKPLEAAQIKLSSIARNAVVDIVRNHPDMVNAITDLFRETGEKKSSTIGSSFEHTTKTRLGKGVSETGKRTQKLSDVVRETRMATRKDMDYRSADALEKKLRGMKYKYPKLGAIADELDKALQDAAKTAGLDKERTQYKEWWNRLSDIESRGATSVKRSVIRAMIRDHGRGLGKLVGEGAPQMDKSVIEDANKLMHEIHGEAERAVMRKISSATAKASKWYRGATMTWKALVNALDSPSGGV